MLLGEETDSNIKMLDIDFWVFTPKRLTSSGNFGVAVAALVCVNTVFMSGSVPKSKVI